MKTVTRLRLKHDASPEVNVNEAEFEFHLVQGRVIEVEDPRAVATLLRTGLIEVVEEGEEDSHAN
jgi:hypothetical protein